MDLTSERIRVTGRLERAEAEMQRAVRERDGSPEAQTRYALARDEYALAEAEARLLLMLLLRSHWPSSGQSAPNAPKLPLV